MKRRSFLQALGAIVGAAALTPEVVDALPVDVADTTPVALGSFVGDEFKPWATVTVASFALSNPTNIVFPTATQITLLTHVRVLDQTIPLARSTCLCAGDTITIAAGHLNLCEEA